MSDVAVAFGVIGVILVVEIVLSARWNRSYFTIGVPIFVRRIERTTGIADLSLEDLQRSGATAAGAPIVFRRLAPDVIAFREKPFGGQLHYMPLMHGVIRHRPEEPYVVVTGLVNWTMLALVAAFAVLLRKGFVDVAPYFAVTFAVIYLIQSLRYARVARSMRQSG